MALCEAVRVVLGLNDPVNQTLEWQTTEKLASANCEKGFWRGVNFLALSIIILSADGIYRRSLCLNPTDRLPLPAIKAGPEGQSEGMDIWRNRTNPPVRFTARYLVNPV